jgi:penicillin G amidase
MVKRVTAPAQVSSILVTPARSRQSRPVRADVPPRPRSTWRRLGRWVIRVLACLTLLLLLLAASGWWALRGSLARLDGTTRLPGLSAVVLIERDEAGVATVTATNRTDLARATGFLHAQDRFFQMDLLRRAAAGELCELFGPGPLDYDRFLRRLRLRDKAEHAIAQLAPADRELLNSYAEGVNAGLAALAVRPPEYLLLRRAPRPWKPADSVLVLHRMGLELSDPSADQEAASAIAHQALSPAAFDFYVRPDTACPAALDDAESPTPRLPTAEEFDARSAPANPQAAITGKEDLVPGSNAWAVGGRRATHGGAILANDMHLGLGLPNIWYRMQFVWRDQDGAKRRCIGVTLPGTPAVVVGSNGHVAWGFTAAQLDVSDQVLLDSDPAHPDACRVANEWQPFQRFHEEIAVAGKTNSVAEFLWSPWGPVGTNLLGQRVAFCWAMQFPEAVNFGLLAFERAATAEQVLDLAPRCGLPWLNVIAADRDGNIGWTLGGRFPKRIGFDGRRPVSWADGTCRWEGWVAPEDTPRVFNPPGAALWSANNPALGSEAYLRLMGGDLTDHGARARQIRDQLLRLTNAHPADLLAIQLDDRALLLEPWQRLLVATLDHATNETDFTEARALAANWGGHAAVDSAGYRLVRSFRQHVLRMLLAPAVARCRTVCDRFAYLPGHHEGVAWDLLQSRPAHLLPLAFASYDELLVGAARQTLAEVPASRPLADWTWGDANRVRLQHPLGRAIPRLSRWLDLPERRLPGDEDMPRVQGRSFGASERLVVAPGRESEGLFHMPGGQSGHFLSPFYAAGYQDWEEGRPSALLPGVTRHRLRLRP